MTGIYIIKNTQNGHVYIGRTYSSTTVRWQKHVNDLKYGKHHNKSLQSDWNLFGKDAFKFDVLEAIHWEIGRGFGIFDEREQYWMDYYKNMGCVMYNSINSKKAKSK